MKKKINNRAYLIDQCLVYSIKDGCTTVTARVMFAFRDFTTLKRKPLSNWHSVHVNNILLLVNLHKKKDIYIARMH